MVCDDGFKIDLEWRYLLTIQSWIIMQLSALVRTAILPDPKYNSQLDENMFAMVR